MKALQPLEPSITLNCIRTRCDIISKLVLEPKVEGGCGVGGGGVDE